MQPVILDKAQNGGLIRQAVVDKVAPRERGDHQKRQVRTIAATALGMIHSGPGKGSRPVAARLSACG